MAAITTSAKTCLRCGTDVARAKRFKATDGSYLCAACNEKVKQEAATSVCPICKKTVSPIAMVRTGGQYICESCGDAAGSTKAGTRGASPEKARTRKLLAVFAVLLTIMLAYWYQVYM